MLHGDPGLSVTELGKRVGLSQPAAARMVDGLEKRGLVERHATFGRWVAVHLTDDGRRAAEEVLQSRGGRLTELVSRLDEREQAELATLLSTLLDAVYDEIGSAELLCRLCDRQACTAERSTCPVGAAERERNG